MSWRADSKRRKSCNSATRRDQLNAAHAHQRLHERLQAPVGQRVAHRLLEPRDARGGLADRVQVFLEPDLLGSMLHPQRGQPAHVRCRPGALAGVGDAVAQQQRLEPVAPVAALAYRVIATTDQVAHRLIGPTRHTHRLEISRSPRSSQHHRVAPVGLDTIARASGNRRRRHHLAVNAVCAQVAPDHEPAGPGFVDQVQPVASADQLAQRLVERRQIAADAAHVAHLAVAPGIGGGDVDAVLVHVQTDVQSDRFIHGPSPREFAMT
jgi:hypothetical protein